MGFDGWVRGLGLVVLVLVAGCSGKLSREDGSGEDERGDDAGVQSDEDSGPVDLGEEQEPASVRLKRKSGDQVARDLSNGLQIPRAEVCRELGLYDCVDVVHTIVLGGVDAYELRIDRPLQAPALTTPLAIERMAWAACGRALQDAETPMDRSAEAASLIAAALHREPQAAEVERLAEFGPDLGDEDWAVSACFIAATSFEALFY